jgi:2-phosphosulfolactate phosphatase
VRLDVFFGGYQLTPADLQGRVVLVIDVLRASTTVAVALANGARAVIPFESSDEVIARAKQFEREDVLLAGERRMKAIPGFDLGNSPREYTREAVEGKTVLLTTTNGTVALANIQGARGCRILRQLLCGVGDASRGRARRRGHLDRVCRARQAVRPRGRRVCRPVHARGHPAARQRSCQRRGAGV